jgi:hypothetical protein
MIKKTSVVTLLLLITACTWGQTLATFPTEKDKFLKAVDQLLKASKSDALAATDDEFMKNVKDGAITDAQVQEIIVTANVLAPRGLQPFPYYNNFFMSINNMVRNKVSGDRLFTWLKVCASVARNQKKGDNKDLAKYLEFSIAMSQYNAMYHSAGRTWRSDAANYTLSYENAKAVVSFPAGKLTGSSTTDTIYIYNTSGKFLPSEDKWYGKGGKVDWTRNKMSASNVYANFRSEYTINFDNTIYTVDSVEFYYKDFFQTPLYGNFTDKFISGGNDSSASYPRFNSTGRNITMKDVVPNATYVGGFGLWGSKVIGVGTPDTPAAVTFFRKDKKRMLTAYSQSFTIRKGEEVSSPKTEVMIFNGNDTIYHPELTLTYKAKNNEVKMLRGESGISKSKFFDSYHNHEFEVDAIIWNLDSNRMKLQTLNGVGQVGSIFESNNYFNKDRIRKIQGGASYEPLSIIKRMYEKTGSKQLNATDLARAIDPHLTEEQAKSLYYELVEMGFIRYDEAAGIVTMRDKVINYVMSNSKKVDYDIIRIKSIPKDGIDYIDLKNNNVELKGVASVPISDTASVVIFPANKTIKLQKDRDMEFDGLVYGGRLDFFGKNYKFDYAPFTIDLNGLDSMRINIPDSANSLDEYGQPKLRTLLTDIIGVKGLLEVDAPINKSGRTRLSQFPKLTSKDKSYASYEDPAIAGGAYKRKDFYFEINPFKLDSLNSFTPSVINWGGRLVSGGIFPDVKNNLHIMPDLSLGFDITTPDNGLDLYKDITKDGSKYEGGLTLNHKGLSGKGTINHLTATFTSQDIMFYPDSLRAVADTFHIKKIPDGVRTPEVTSGGNMVFWKPKSDSMLIFMKTTPFAMYENQTKLSGNLLLTGKGLRGSGLLDWREANITSRDFQFRSDDLAADTAGLDIKSASGDKVTFKTPNVNAKIDFKNRVGDFKTNTPDIPTEFAYNNFKTDIGEFKWYIDQKILDFNVPKGSNGEYFTSTRTSQLGLKFLAKRATYNLETSILRAEQVPYINIADAKVVPDSGIVVIEGEAKIDQLKNATIYVDTITNRHKIVNCTVDIISKAELKGTGEYSFSTAGHKDQKITFNDIKCTKEVIGDNKKNQFNEYSLVAKGDVGDSANPFYIYPNVTYHGEAYLYGKNPYLFMKGYAKINFKNPDVTSDDFKIIDDINPDTLFLHYDSTTKSSDGPRTVTGIYFDKQGELPTIYHALFTQIHHASDLCLFKAPGVVTFNARTNEYLMGDEDKIKKGLLAGNLMKYNDDKGIIKGEGEMSLGADFQVIRSEAAGTMEVDLKKKQYTFNMTFGLDMKTGNKSLDEKFQTIMFNDNTDLPDINYEGDRFKMVYSNLADPKVDDKLIKNLDVVPTFVRPKDFDYSLVFSDVNFIYDPDDLTLRSYGKIGVAMVGDKAINKRLDGFIEIGLKNNNFNIYIKTGANEWFYFEYKPNSLGLISSYDDYNRIVGTIIMTPSEKRKITGDKNQWYVVNLGSTINKGAFLDAMKEKNSPLLPIEKVKPKIPKDSTAIKAPRGGDAPKADTTAAIVPVTGKAPADTAKANAEKKENAMTPAQRRAARLRSKANQEEVPPATAPAAPADTSGKQPAATPTPVAPPADTAKGMFHFDAPPVRQQAPTPVPPVDTTRVINAPPARQPDATPPPVPAATPVDTTKHTDAAPAKQPDVVPVKQAEVPVAMPVPAATPADTTRHPDATPVKQPDASPPPVPAATPVDTTKHSDAAPVKQPDVIPVRQTEVPAPVPAATPVDTTKHSDAAPVKQPDAVPVPARQADVSPVPVAAPIPVTPPTDSIGNVAKQIQPPTPGVPNPTTPIDSGSIRQSIQTPADTTTSPH